MKPTTEQLEALREQLKALNSGYVGLLAAKFGGKYTESHIRMVLNSVRNNNQILDKAMELLVELTEEQQERLERLKAFTTTEKAA